MKNMPRVPVLLHIRGNLIEMFKTMRGSDKVKQKGKGFQRWEDWSPEDVALR